MSAAALPAWWPKSGLAWLLMMLALVAAPMVVQAWRYRYPAADYLRIPFQAAAGLVVAVLAFTVLLMPLEGLLLGEAVARRWQGLHLALLPVAGYLSWRWWSRKRLPTEWIRRGAVVADGTPYAEQTAAAKRERAREGRVLLSLAGVWVPPADEAKHFKLIGSTGTGKSTAIAELMRGALARGDRAVFADPDGGYLARFYEPARGDVVLNPFDARSVRWDLFGEIEARFDADQLARSLIVGEDSWSGYARTFLAALIWRCHQDGHRDVAELWRLAAVAASDELRELVAGTPAQPFLEPDNARMFGSIRSVTVAAIAGLQYVAEQPGTAQAFSVRRWVREGRGVLFLPYQAEQIAALRSVIATWVRLAIFQTMGLGEVVPGQAGERRLWFVVDELDALGRIDGLKDALARLRKFGGRCVLGFQSIAQMSSTYGQGEARTIVENCGNTLILRCSASEGGGTAQFASMLIGQRELVRQHVSVTHSREGLLGERERSVSYSDQHVTEAAVLASEIEALADRVGYFKLASQPAWLQVRLALPQER